MNLFKKVIKTVFKEEINNLKGDIGEIKGSRRLSIDFFDNVIHRQINDLTIIFAKINILS